MMTTSLRRLVLGGMLTTSRGAGVRLVIQVSPRSTTTVEGLGEHDDGRQHVADEHAGTARCPFKLPVNSADSVNARPMHELDGPIGWPIVGNFLTYLKKSNQGKMHEVQVSRTL